MSAEPEPTSYHAAILDAEITQRRAARRRWALADAELLSQRGWLAELALRYRDAAGFYREAADLVGFDDVMARYYRFRCTAALTRAASQETGA